MLALYVCTYVFLLAYIGTYYILNISNIIAGPCATYNSKGDQM